MGFHMGLCPAFIPPFVPRTTTCRLSKLLVRRTKVVLLHDLRRMPNPGTLYRVTQRLRTLLLRLIRMLSNGRIGRYGVKLFRFYICGVPSGGLLLCKWLVFSNDTMVIFLAFYMQTFWHSDVGHIAQCQTSTKNHRSVSESRPGRSCDCVTVFGLAVP